MLDELGIATTAYGVLSRGLLSGSQPTGAGDFRAHLPRFKGETGASNQRMVDKLAQIAGDKGMTQVQLADCVGTGEESVHHAGHRARASAPNLRKPWER